MKSLLSSVFLLTSVFSHSVFASDKVDDRILSWSSVSVGQAKVESDMIDESVKVLKLDFKGMVGSNFFFKGGLLKNTSDFISNGSHYDIINAYIGFGALAHVGETTDLFVSGSFLNSETKTKTGDVDSGNFKVFDAGFRSVYDEKIDISVYMTYMLFDNVQRFDSGNGGVIYAKVSDSLTAYNAELSYLLSEDFSVGMSYSKHSKYNESIAGVNISYYF